LKAYKRQLVGIDWRWRWTAREKRVYGTGLHGSSSRGTEV